MSGVYSLPDLIERMYENQLALEAAWMELALQSEKQGHLLMALLFLLNERLH